MIRRLLVTMNETAIRALAMKWWFKGFAASGRGFNGETFDLAKYPAIQSMLETEFARHWDDAERKKS